MLHMKLEQSLQSLHNVQDLCMFFFWPSQDHCCASRQQCNFSICLLQSVFYGYSSSTQTIEFVFNDQGPGNREGLCCSVLGDQKIFPPGSKHMVTDTSQTLWAQWRSLGQWSPCYRSLPSRSIKTLWQVVAKYRSILCLSPLARPPLTHTLSWVIWLIRCHQSALAFF